MCSRLWSRETKRWETGSALDGINSAALDDKSQSKGEVHYEDEDRPEQRYKRLQLLLCSGAAPVMQQVNITL